MTLLRREFLHLIVGAASAPALALRPAVAQASARGACAWQLDCSQRGRASHGSAPRRASSGAWDRDGPAAIAVGGPRRLLASFAAIGSLHTGALPVAEEVLKGRDIVILATPTSEFPSFVMTRKEITQLAQLNGKKVGVLTETGQTSVATRITIETAGATATYLPLIRFDRIYAALAAGEIDAGALPIDLRFTGEVRYGWNAFPSTSLERRQSSRARAS